MPTPRKVLLDDPRFKVEERVMDNGETRLSATCSGGSVFVRTTASSGEPAWQNAHRHRYTREFYVVVTGWMVVAERVNGKNNIKVYFPGQSYMSQPWIDHNILLLPGADIDTLKFCAHEQGEGDKDSDWYSADPEFDAWTKSLTIEAIEKMGIGVLPKSL